MDAKEVIAEVRDAIAHEKVQGQQVIAVDALIDYLNKLEQDASKSTDILLAEFRAKQESGLAHWRATFEANLEGIRAINQAGDSALRGAILINGAAAVALLAFLGSVWASKSGIKPDFANFPGAMLTFLLGVLVGAIATGTKYLALFAGHSGSTRTFNLINAVTILLVLASYIAFLVGGILAFCSFVSS